MGLSRDSGGLSFLHFVPGRVIYALRLFTFLTFKRTLQELNQADRRPHISTLLTFPFISCSLFHLGSRPTQRQTTPRRVTSARPVRRGAALAGGPAFARCCRRRRRPRLLSQDGGSSGRVFQRREPGVVPDVPGAAAAGRGGSLRLPVQNAGSKYPCLRGPRGRAGV